MPPPATRYIGVRIYLAGAGLGSQPGVVGDRTNPGSHEPSPGRGAQANMWTLIMDRTKATMQSTNRTLLMG